VSFADERADLIDEARHLGCIFRIAFGDQFVALRPYADVEKRFEMAEILVVCPEEGLDSRLGDGDLSCGCRWDSCISLSYSSL
jgi:hypothetical protein